MVGQGVADSQGVYIITSGPLNQGLDHLTVTATDAAGNVGAPSAVLAITVDSIAPDAPDAPTLAAESDTGAIDSDGVTDTATPTLTGSDAEAGTTITLYDTDGIAVLGTAVVNAKGTYTITPALLSDGAHTLTVTATDHAGNVSSVSAPLNVTIDTEPPLAPTLDDGVGKIAILGQTVDVTGTAEAGATVTLQVDGGNITFGDATVSADGDYDIGSDLLLPGAHKLTVIATDLAGNASQPSLAANVTITATPGPPPGVPPNTPFTAGFGLDGYISGATVFGDANHNGVFDPGEASTLTDSSGAFKLYATDVPLGLTGGIDTTTGLTLPGTLEAPESVTVISPISTFYVAYEAAAGTDSLSDQTQDAAAAALGIDPANLRRDDGLGEDDLLGRDPLASAAAGTIGPEIADAKLIDTAVDFAAVIGGAGGSESRAFGAVFTAIAQQAVASGAAFDFDSTTALSAALLAAADGLSLPDALVSAAAQAVAAGNMAIDAQSGSAGGSSLLAYVAGAEIVAQGALAQALTAAGQMPTAAVSLLAPYSGSALATDISNAEQSGLSVPRLAPGSDTGFWQTDDITSDRTPTLVGTALPGASVDLVLDIGSGSPVIGVGTADATGHYSIQVTALPSNGGLIYATLGSPTAPVTIGSTVNPPASASLSFLDVYIPTKQTLVDGLPYIKEAVEQTSGDPTEAPLLVSGFANTNDGALVSIYADGNPVPIGTAFTYGDFGIETSPLSVGSHVLTVTSTAIDGVVYSGTTSFTTTLAAPSSFSGQASANGPIAGAEAYYSTDGSSEEAVPLDDVGSVTDSQGRYTLPGDGNSYGLIRLTGGYDTLTGSSLAPAEAGGTSAEMASGYSYDLLAPEGAGAITPLTTLVAEIPFSGPTVQQANVNAEQKVETGLGLTSGLDLLSLDPLAEAEAGDTAPFLAAAKLLDTATLVAAVRGGFQNAFAEIAQSINTNGTIDLDSAANIDAIIGRSLGGNTDLTAADIQLLSATIAASNAAIDAHAATASSVADLLSYTLAVERVAGGAETTAVQAALNNAYNSYQTGYVDSFPGIEAAFSGSNLDAAAAAALTQATQVTRFVSNEPSSTGAASADYTITFSQPVTGVSAGDFTAVAGSGLVGAHVTGVTPVQGSGGSTYDVSVATGIGQGTLAVAFSGTGILDADGLPLTSGGFESTLIPTENFSSYSSGVALGDFNGDGRPDIIASGPQNAGTLELFLNQGNGVFATHGTIAGERGAAAVAVGDFNGDGKLDAVTADAGGNLGNNNAVSIVLGNGDGTFEAPVIAGAEPDPTAIAVGDLNHDGRPDIVTVDHDIDPQTGAVVSSSLGILLGNGDGTFTPAPTIAGGGGGVAVADVNGDGNLDLVTTSGLGGDTVSIFYGNGDGTFTAAPQPSVTTGNGPIGVAVGDVNGDGIPDIVTANATDNSVSVLLGSATGAFTALSPIVFPADVYGDRLSPASIAIADTNDDGIPDIVVSGHGTAINTVVLIGAGDGTFTTGFTTSTAGTGAVAVGDLDGDGRADIVLTDAAGAASDAIGVLTNIAQPVLSSTSAPVTIDRPTVAAPVVTELAGGGTLTQTGNAYTLDLGTLTQGQAEAALQFGLSNAAAIGADAFDGIFGAPIGTGFTVAGAALPAAVSAGQSYAGLTYTADTTALGSHTETLTFAPRDETDTSGRSTTLATGDLASDDPATVPAAALPTDVAGELPAIALVVTDDVVAPTAPLAALDAAQAVAFGNVRVGTPDSQALPVANTAAIGAGMLDVSATASGQASVTGSVSRLAPGATDPSDITVNLDTSAAGARSGGVMLTPSSDAGTGTPIPMAGATVAVSGAVYRPAAPAIAPLSTIVHVGDPSTFVLTVANKAPADGYSEDLVADLTGVTGALAGSGTTGEIAAGTSDATSLSITVSTAAAGVISGTATVALTSDGGAPPRKGASSDVAFDDIDGLGTLGLPSASVPVSITVDNDALAALAEISGGGQLHHHGGRLHARPWHDHARRIARDGRPRGDERRGGSGRLSVRQFHDERFQRLHRRVDGGQRHRGGRQLRSRDRDALDSHRRRRIGSHRLLGDRLQRQRLFCHPRRQDADHRG